MENSAIEWCDHTFNPWIGCMKVSAGCKRCYAEVQDHRFGGDNWGPAATTQRTKTSAKNWAKPLKWQRDAEKNGVVLRVFCASMADVFEDHPMLTDWRNELFELIEATPNLQWLILTKRPENIKRFIPARWEDNINFGKWPANVVMGTSVEDQNVIGRVYDLMRCKAKTKFLSCEPMIGNINLSLIPSPQDGTFAHALKITEDWYPGDGWLSGIDWVICGGESGPGARPMHPDWAYNLRDQVVDAHKLFFFKQWGEWAPIDMPHDQDNIAPLAKNERWMNLEGGHGFHGERVYRMRSVGKKESGSTLGVDIYKQYPELKLKKDALR